MYKTAGSVQPEIDVIRKLASTGRFQEAERAARELLLRHPKRGDINDILAIVLIAAGKADEAVRFSEAAVAAEPNNPGYLVTLGRLYLKIELIEEALPLLERAFKVDKKYYHAPLALGDFFFKTGKGERAVGYLQQALRACPREEEPAIEMNLADCLSALGRIEESEKLYLKLVDLPAFRGLALANAAGLQKRTIDSGIARRVQHALDKSDIPGDHQAALHLVWGKILDDGGNHAAAFEQWQMSKTTQSREHSPSIFASKIEDLIASFRPETLMQFADYGVRSDLPVFVVGMPRSGTTLTEQIIAAHPRGGGVGELRRVGAMWEGLSGNRSAKLGFSQMTEAGATRCGELVNGYLRMLRFLAPDALRVVDKMPHNFLCIGFIAIMFPDARIVHCIRHPADNFISAFQNRMNGSHSYSFSPAGYAEYFKHYVKLMQHWHALLPGRIFSLRYEDLTADPEGKSRELMSYLGVPWDERCLRFYEERSTVRTFSRHQVRNPVHRGSVEKWRRYSHELSPLIGALQSEIAALGYEAS